MLLSQAFPIALILALLYISMGCDPISPDQVEPVAVDDSYTDSDDDEDLFSDNVHYRLVEGENEYWELDVLANDEKGISRFGVPYPTNIASIDTTSSKAKGTFRLKGPVSAKTHIEYVEYVPAPEENWDGIVEFKYTARFGTERFDEATVTIDVNSLNRAQTSYPTEEAPMTATSAPSIISSISTFNSQTISRGETTRPLVFSISHSESSIDLSSLTVIANSDNPSLIPNTNIEVDTTDPGQCTLVVKHEGNHAGQARITVTVQDIYGVSSSTSFLITVQDSSTN